MNHREVHIIIITMKMCRQPAQKDIGWRCLSRCVPAYIITARPVHDIVERTAVHSRLDVNQFLIRTEVVACLLVLESGLSSRRASG